MSRGEPAGPDPRRQRAWTTPSLVALVALLPFAGGILAGRSLYFRDLTLQFFPLRLFALEGLRHGELRFWNPYVHEGEPSSLPPISYPLDLLQAFLPSEAGLSTSLALHVPLGALAFFALAHGLGLGRGAAAGGALVYALGGFSLSTLNLYVYVQAIAWAPLVVLGLQRAARDRGAVAPAALACAVALSTTGAEIVAQALVLGLVVAAPGRDRRAWLRTLGAVVLGIGIAAPTIAYMAGLVASSARAGGFPTAVVLAHSIHPLTFAQVVIAGFYGDPSDLVNRWWGSNFFPRGFPYFLSLYLGATVLALAAVGIRHGGSLGRRLVALAAVAAIVCLGRWAHLSMPLEALPILRSFRFPSKAFFTVHAAAALLTALGLDALATGARRPWRWLAVAALCGGAILALLPFAPTLLPGPSQWFAAGFFPPGYAWPARADLLGQVLADAAKGGLVATVVGLVAVFVLRGRIRPGPALTLVAALAVADLLRAGVGLNRTVDPGLFVPSAEVRSLARTLREKGGRIYTPDPAESPAHAEARRLRPLDHELWSFAVLVDSATPFQNLRLGLPSALSIDLTMLVPTDRVLAPEQAGPGAVPEMLPLLRDAGVAWVLSLDPLHDERLAPRAVVATSRIAPLRVHVYEVTSPLPLRSVATEVVGARSRDEARSLAGRPGFQEGGGVAVEGPVGPVTGALGRLIDARERPGWIEASVEADRPSVFLVRDAYAPGWSATVDGQPAPLLRANGRHCAVPIPGGRSRVTLRYAPPRMRTGLAVSALSLLATLALLARSRQERARVTR